MLGWLAVPKTLEIKGNVLIATLNLYPRIIYVSFSALNYKYLHDGKKPLDLQASKRKGRDAEKFAPQELKPSVFPLCNLTLYMQNDPGTEPEPSKAVLPETERGTGTVGTVPSTNRFRQFIDENFQRVLSAIVESPQKRVWLQLPLDPPMATGGPSPQATSALSPPSSPSPSPYPPPLALFAVLREGAALAVLGEGS